MIGERFIIDCLWQSSAALGVGVLLSFLWSNRPARAHRMLLLGMAAAVLLPALSYWVRAQDWGLFQERQQVSTLSGNELPGLKPDNQRKAICWSRDEMWASRLEMIEIAATVLSASS